MNMLGLVFSILLILSYGYYSFFDKSTTSCRLRNTYLLNQQANRDILNAYESLVYNKNCQRARPEKTEPRTIKKEKEPLKEEELEEEEEEKISSFNQECAKINIWPLLQEGREGQPALYELTAQLVRLFYEPIAPKEKRFEYRFLDQFLVSCKASLQKEGSLVFEKIDLVEPALQRIYYKMVKGTKKWNLSEKKGYPPLLDYIQAIPNSTDKICLFHANIDLLTALFGPKVAYKIYHEAHKPNGSPITLELVERLSIENGRLRVDPDLIHFMRFGKHPLKNQKMPFASEKGAVLLRRDLPVEG